MQIVSPLPWIRTKSYGGIFFSSFLEGIPTFVLLWVNFFSSFFTSLFVKISFFSRGLRKFLLGGPNFFWQLNFFLKGQHFFLGDKKNGRGQTDKKKTDGHGNSMTESAPLGGFSENISSLIDQCYLPTPFSFLFYSWLSYAGIQILSNLVLIKPFRNDLNINYLKRLWSWKSNYLGKTRVETLSPWFQPNQFILINK